ncbi:oxidative damage protection protein [Candidatus Synchoanobacter obligatus]|uniref:Oxidative damage protection protein n=1 Tax=Candidatus Synchoanobacter obligatus TaxID=2919597 RepID=A0ABT1L665_9GAMM|nr:oxidative damage protection protein [Candidatus Synchoanobacter obligatus]MCP8352579.1 oxidative damage protection protein [Candidatus Synchoanobacter obligatus]
MSNLIYCKKLKQNLPQLAFLPFPGDMGARIQQNISAEAWQQWLIQQTKLINEYRMDPMSEKTQQFLREEMESFLFE